MAYTIRAQNVVTPRPSPGPPGARPTIAVVSNSVGAIATALTGQWAGIRNTFAYTWARNTATIAGFNAASASIQSNGTLYCTVNVTNPYGSKAVPTLGVVVL